LISWTFEEKLRRCGFTSIAGVDEAGRGPLAGPVFAASVILPSDMDILGIDDSKKLTEKVREKVYEKIIKESLAYSISSSSVQEIDRLNILNATILAMDRSIKSLNIVPDFVLIDGNINVELPCKSQCIIKGDSQSVSIAAASILAKVTRDRYMSDLHNSSEKFCLYCWDKNKGYPTQEHYEKIRKFGPCEHHRKSFNLYRDLNLNVKIGKYGEDKAVEYLQSLGNKVIERNYRCKYGEIDIIFYDNSSKDLVFTEVKTRSNNKFGIPSEAVNSSKLAKIKNTVMFYLKETENYDIPHRIDVIEILINLKANSKIRLRHHRYV